VWDTCPTLTRQSEKLVSIAAPTSAPFPPLYVRKQLAGPPLAYTDVLSTMMSSALAAMSSRSASALHATVRVQCPPARVEAQVSCNYVKIISRSYAIIASTC
jgi:hypothetical protein